MDMPKLLDGRLKLRHLLLVDALSRQGSVVGAAAALHITQPVATRSLHDIESILASRSSTAAHAASPRPFSARPSQLMHGP